MIGKVGLALLTAVSLAACQPSAPDNAKASEEQPPVRTAVIATAAPFINTDAGIRAVFPVGARVCEALSGDSPQGFYTRLGDDRMTCVPARDPPKVSSMVILATYNSAFYRRMDEVIGPDCPKLNPKEADGRTLGFPGLEATVCESGKPDGDIEISVNAFAGSWEEEPGRMAPHMIYSAYLFTTTATETTDRVTFQRFLDQVRLTPPVPAT